MTISNEALEEIRKRLAYVYENGLEHNSAEAAWDLASTLYNAMVDLIEDEAVSDIQELKDRIRELRTQVRVVNDRAEDYRKLLENRDQHIRYLERELANARIM